METRKRRHRPSFPGARLFLPSPRQAPVLTELLPYTVPFPTVVGPVKVPVPLKHFCHRLQGGIAHAEHTINPMDWESPAMTLCGLLFNTGMFNNLSFYLSWCYRSKSVARW